MTAAEDRRADAEAEEAAWVRRVVDAAPPPDQGTLDRVAELLSPADDTSDRPQVSSPNTFGGPR